MLLRLIALHPLSHVPLSNTKQPQHNSIAANIIQALAKNGIISNSDRTSVTSNSQPLPLESYSAARSMAWCVLSNAFGSNDIPSMKKLKENHHDIKDVENEQNQHHLHGVTVEELIEVSLQDLFEENQKHVEVRKGASAFLYNITRFHIQTMFPSFFTNTCLNIETAEEEDIPDIVVMVLCRTLEGLVEEKNPTAKLRRLMVVGKLLFSHREDDTGEQKTKVAVNQRTKDLIMELGFDESIHELSRKNSISFDDNNSIADAKKIQELALEIKSLLSYKP
mmetsp:Transcript_8080/g.11547  ORF Transcript_8080/g.11547 Transcript_8080/m.11547 type:complete len:279 (+) Transcript_8080:251-1087(+)